tara:strand:- start:550 stop:1179 length:630 start_codon:yes stop_codon:yes gene_type:complete
MPLQNRVTPDGEIVVDPAKGIFMGNRGILHQDNRTLGSKRWAHKNWVTCLLSFGGRKRTLMSPGRYTELFFLDEAVSLAAGHRPCGECRKLDFAHFRECWQKAHGGDFPRPNEIDRRLHQARVNSRSRIQIRYSAPIDSLPDGVFVRLEGALAPRLVRGEKLLTYSTAGYQASIARPSGLDVEVLTPSPSVEVMLAGYLPALHPSALNL